MKIGELANHTKLSVHTLRYYERIGLLPRAWRNASKHREYDAGILSWLEFLGRLKATGMPLKGMLVYAKLREQGSGTETERRELLAEHRKQVCAKISELQENLATIDAKIDFYIELEKRNNHE